MIVGLYLFLVFARAAMALRYPRSAGVSGHDTIVQPILSGDPLLEGMLARNLTAHPEASFLWMIDEDDSEAHRIAAKLARPNVHVIVCEAPRDGENPKLAKLIRALEVQRWAVAGRLIVLDDDTFLPGDLPAGALVTGLPIFTAKGTLYERLIGGFVNGGALLTYLPAAALGLQRTINGMIYSVDPAQLQSLGGFAAAGHELTDDYAVARLYLRNGLGITQSIVPAHVEMTVTTASHYIRVMRRWMMFAARYFGDNATLATVFWIALPSLLPLIGMVVNPVVWIPTLLLKSLLNRLILWRITTVSSTPLDLMFEVAADLLNPIWMTLAFVQPNRLSWRNRKIELENGAIRYK